MNNHLVENSFLSMVAELVKINLKKPGLSKKEKTLINALREKCIEHGFLKK